MNTGFIVEAIKGNKRNFILIFLVVLLLAAFAMSFVSLPALLYDREILFAPDVSIFGFAYLLLFSFLLTLIFVINLYKKQTASAAGDATSFAGMFFGALSSGCAFCQSLLVGSLAVIGIPFSYNVLPFKGEEFKAISLLLLFGAVYFASKGKKKDNKCDSC